METIVIRKDEAMICTVQEPFPVGFGNLVCVDAKTWIEDAEKFGLSPDEILYALKTGAKIY